MSELLQSIDARASLAGTNKLEILMFHLGVSQATGRKETFGINVFKVREVMRVPDITGAPDMPEAVEGMVSLRGTLVPVIDLTKYTQSNPDQKPEIMIVTEYNKTVQGFLVGGVDTILRLDWSDMKIPPDTLSTGASGLLTGVTELPDGRLVMMLDVEKVMADTIHYDDTLDFDSIQVLESREPGMVFYADDSSIARKQIERTLNKMGIENRCANTGLRAWEALQILADESAAKNIPLKDRLSLVLTDAEMPEMDGYVLTRNIKSDPRFAGIPVIMYSSLSSVNEHLGKSVGIDKYVSKLQPNELAEAVASFISIREGAQP